MQSQWGAAVTTPLGTMVRSLVFATAVAAGVTAATYHNDIEAVALDLPNAVGKSLPAAR